LLAAFVVAAKRQVAYQPGGALAAVQATGERFYEAELYRLKRDITLQACMAAPTADANVREQAQAQAQEFFVKAIRISHAQEAKSLELRATMGLARLWQSQRKKPQAHKVLCDIYHWFTEGFGTKDLQGAKALLDELA
jgi:predicted ATPase